MRFCGTNPSPKTDTDENTGKKCKPDDIDRVPGVQVVSLLDDVVMEVDQRRCAQCQNILQPAVAHL